LNGSVDFFSRYTPTLRLHAGQICKENGEDIPLDAPTLSRGSDKGSDGWTPYDNRLQFEVADFYSAEIRCRLETPTSFSSSGPHLWPSLILNSHSGTLHTSNVIDLTPVTPLGDVTWRSFIHSPYSIMDTDVWKTAHHGCKRNMTFGFGILARWSTTSCPSPISGPVSITRRIKSTPLEFIASKTSRLGPSELGLEPSGRSSVQCGGLVLIPITLGYYC
jgi:hypothetical protein